MAPLLTLKLNQGAWDWEGKVAGELSSEVAVKPSSHLAKWLENQVVEQLSIQETLEAKVVRRLKSWGVK